MDGVHRSVRHGKGRGKIAPAGILYSSIEGTSSQVINRDAWAGRQQSVLNEFVEQDAWHVCFRTQRENVGVPFQILADPFVTVIVVGGHVIVEVQPLINFSVL